MGTKNDDCIAAVIRMILRINLVQIYEFIDNVPYISELQKKFTCQPGTT